MRWQRRQLKTPAKRSSISDRQGEGRSWPRIALLGVGLGAVVAIGGEPARRAAPGPGRACAGAPTGPRPARGGGGLAAAPESENSTPEQPGGDPGWWDAQPRETRTR